MNPLSAQQELRQSLRPMRARERAVRAVAVTAPVFCVAALGSVVASALLAWQGAVLARDAAQLNHWRLAAAIMPWGVAVVVLLLTWLQPRRYPQVARMVDERCQLRDRISSAWVFSSEVAADGLKRLQVADSLQQLHRLEPRKVMPWRFSRQWSWGVVAWFLSLGVGTFGQQAVATLTQRAEQQQSQDAANLTLAAQLEKTLLHDLKKFAELTGMPPQENVILRELAESVEQKLEKLKRQGTTREESLATLSEIQAAISRASGKFDSSEVESQMQELAQVLAAAESLDAVAEPLQKQDYLQAARNLEQVDPRKVTELERQTLADELKQVVEQMKGEQLGDLANATNAMQEAMAENDQVAMSTAAQQMAAQLRQQANRAEIEAELQQQLASLAEAKGQSRSGGSNIDPSNEDRSTFGRGKAGDPEAEAEAALATTRQREELQGAAGEGPSERETMPSEKAEVVATREYQAKYDQYQRAAEAALRHESLPLGHRQTIRNYFESLRP